MVNAFPEPIILPVIFNDDNNVVSLFNVVFPDTFNVDMNVEGLLKLAASTTSATP